MPRNNSATSAGRFRVEFELDEHALSSASDRERDYSAGRLVVSHKGVEVMWELLVFHFASLEHLRESTCGR
jgi:hypothetical protein